MKCKRMVWFNTEYLHVDRTGLFGMIKAMQIKPWMQVLSHAQAGHTATAKPSQGKSCSSRGWQKYVTHHPPEASTSLLQASTASWYALAFPYPGSAPSSPWQTQGR